MIRSVLTLHTTTVQATEILELYRAEGILEECLGLTRAIAADVAIATDGSGDVIVTALWPDEAAYGEWVAHPNRSRTGPALTQLLAGVEPGVGKLYRIDHAVP
jgi:hypothetical protein